MSLVADWVPLPHLLGHKMLCPSFLLKQLGDCHFCDLETSLDSVSLDLASIRACLSDSVTQGL